MQVSQLGEAELIALLKQTIDDAGVAGSPDDVLLGIGDDAAFLRSGQDHLLVTTDQAIEGVHFLADRISAEAVGWRTMGVNVSDIAAMGGDPRYALVSLAFPPTTPVEWVLHLYEGMAELCRSLGIALVGGDLSSAPLRVISVTLLGIADQGREGRPSILRRSAARPGDRIAVTGTLGGAAAGQTLLFHPTGDAAEPEELINAFLRPPVRLEEAHLLQAAGVRAAIDISDGLVKDLARLCAASGLSARLREDTLLPFHPLLRTFFPAQAIDLALTGGEDYELLFTAPAEVLELALAALPCPATEIGEVVAGPAGRVVILDERGEERSLPYQGWAHF